jgi:hypothetical protein
MSYLPLDTRLDAIIAEAVAKYGQYTGNVVGLGHGRVDRVLEVPVVPTADWEHAYTKTPMINAYKLFYGTAMRVRSFVYVVPLEERDGRRQRMVVGMDGEDLDIATFFRPVGLDAVKGDVYVAMPPQAFAGEGDEVEYAFRVRNYLELSNGTMVPLATLQIGMEYKTSTQRKHDKRGVILITNDQMFSSQLGEEGDMQEGFKMQYVGETSMVDAAPEASKAVLYMQAFGFVARPPSFAERLTGYLGSHFHMKSCARTKGAGQTRSSGGGGGTRGTRGSSSSSLSHGKLLAGASRQMNVTVSAAVPIAERATAEFCLTVGAVARVFHEKQVEAAVGAVSGDDAVIDLTGEEDAGAPRVKSGYAEAMRCLAEMLGHERECSPGFTTHKAELMAAIQNMVSWPTMKVGGPLGLLAPSSQAPIVVGVCQHEDKDDEEGEAMSKTSGCNLHRAYRADIGPLYRVRVSNFSLCGDHVKVQPVYFEVFKPEGVEECEIDEPEEAFVLEPGETFELPFPLQLKVDDHERCGWKLKDDEGKTILCLSFALDETRVAEILALEAKAKHERELEAAAQAVEREKREREERECAMILDAAAEAGNVSDVALGDTVVVECCVCLDKKLVRQMALFKPCCHCVCCTVCYTKQVELDTAAGLRSRCPKCRGPVLGVDRVFF